MKLIEVFVLLVLMASAVSGQQTADLIIVNARVRTMDTKKRLAEAVAVSDGRITSVGSNRKVLALASAATKVIDAGGKLVIPGFNDAHVHFTGVGNWFSHLDGSAVKSSRELLDRIAHFTKFLPKGRWVLGAKLDTGRWQNSQLPTPAEVDAVSPDNPILLYFVDSAKGLVNSAALYAARISLTKPSGESDVVRDESGRVTGIVSGTVLMRIRSAIPKNNGTNWAEIAEAASNYAASLGVTSVQDVHSDNLLATYREMARSGSLKTRIYDCIGLEVWERDLSIGVTAASGDAMVRGGCVKWFSDGTDGETTELSERVAKADKAGLQVLVHAIGERANKNTIDAFTNAASKNGIRDRRFRVEHTHNIANADIARLSRLSIIASMQPALFYREDDLGDDYSYIFRTGARVAFGSDASMIDIDPLEGIHAAVNSGKTGISVDTAVRAYTMGSAYAEFQENEKGSISLGKLADLVILSDDIFTINRLRIREARVVMTILGGKVVYDAETKR